MGQGTRKRWWWARRRSVGIGGEKGWLEALVMKGSAASKEFGLAHFDCRDASGMTAKAEMIDRMCFSLRHSHVYTH